jgi:isopentenyl phosphate kinase
VVTLTNAILVKFGGSVITHKQSSPPAVDKSILERIAKELGAAPEPVIIVLGGGAHGHQAAHMYGYGNSDTPQSRLLQGIPAIRHNMCELAHTVETIFCSAGISSVVIPPFPTVLLENGQIVRFSTDIISRTISAGHVVITHGDVCFDTKQGASILSGDTIVVFLSQNLNIHTVFIGTDVDGIFDRDPRRHSEAKLIPTVDQQNIEHVLELAGPSYSTDVTGGMAKKMKDLVSLSGLGVKATIFNLCVPGNLENLLRGRPVLCTEVIL